MPVKTEIPAVDDNGQNLNEKTAKIEGGVDDKFVSAPVPKTDDGQQEGEGNTHKNHLDSLPLEVYNMVFDFLYLEEKMTVRLVCTKWRNEIHSRSDISFSIPFNNENAKWMNGLTPSRIDLLKVQNLTAEDVNLAFFQAVDIMAVSLAKGNSEENFERILSVMGQPPEGQPGVQELRLEAGSLPYEISLRPYMEEYEEEQPHWMMSSVKILHLELGGENDECPDRYPTPHVERGRTNLDWNDASRSWKMQMLNFAKHNLILPSLETLSVVINAEWGRFRFKNYLQQALSELSAFVNSHPKVKRLHVTIRSSRSEMTEVESGMPPSDFSQLQELKLDMSEASYAPVLAQFFSCNGLRKLWIITRGVGFSYNSNAEILTVFGNVTQSMIKNNCTQLESLTIEGIRIPYEKLALSSCSLLKELSLRTYQITNVPRAKSSIHLPHALSHVRLYLLGNSYSRPENSKNDEDLLALMKNSLEELKIQCYMDYLSIDRLKRLIAFPRMKRIVLQGMDLTTSDFIANRCNSQMQLPNVKTCFANEVGKRRDFCITISR